jgi:selenocysteine lyase/cysteine desulfurase
MRSSNENNESVKAAAELRTIIKELFDAPQIDRIVLTPSILTGLHIFLASLNVKRVAVSTYEYYGQYHLPNLEVRAFGLEGFAEQVKRFRPEAVILSLVSWRGKVLPVGQLFCQLRTALGQKSPLLIADCAHVGALGFPDLTSLGADVVCGDMCKWITPPDWQRNLALLWFRTHSLSVKANKAFAPFYLATLKAQKHLLSRWMDPYEVRTVVSWIRDRRLDRDTLRQRHQHNMELASKLAQQLGVNGPPESSILWLDQVRKRHILFQELEQHGLVWRPPTGGLRILCRAEAQPELTLLANT